MLRVMLAGGVASLLAALRYLPGEIKSLFF
jgi:hypothetical protein